MQTLAVRIALALFCVTLPWGLSPAARAGATPNGWVILGIPSGSGLEPSAAIVRGVYEWALRQPEIAARVREHTPTLAAFRAEFIKRYPFFAASQISRATLRTQLPRLNGQTGVTVPPFLEVGVRSALPDIAARATTRSGVPTPTRRAPIATTTVAPPIATQLQQLRTRLEGVSHDQRGTTQGVADLRERMRALEARLTITAHDATTTTQAVSLLAGHVSTINDRVDTVREANKELVERVSGLERFSVGVMSALALFAVAVAAGVTILVVRALRSRPRPWRRAVPQSASTAAA